MTDIRNDPDFILWEEHVRAELIPMLEGSGANVSIVPPRDGLDVKFADV